MMIVILFFMSLPITAGNNIVPQTGAPIAPWFMPNITGDELKTFLLKSEYDVDSYDSRGYTGLMDACDLLDVARARLFLHAGASPAAQSREQLTLGYTPLHFETANLNDVSFEGNGLEEGGVGLMKHLFDNGADPNAKNALGDTPLHLLTMINKEDNLEKVINLMVIYGVDLNARGKDGMTFLHNLVFARNSRSIALIHGRYSYLIDETIKNNKNQTPLAYAESFWFDESAAALKAPVPDYTKRSVVDFDPSGFNILMIAAMRGDIRLAEQYHAGKGNINAISQDTFKNSALHFALRRSKFEFIQWLVDHGIDVTLKNSDGDCSVHVLARLNNHNLFTNCLSFIAKNPTILNIQNSKGETAIHILVQRKAIETLTMLISQYGNIIDLSIRTGDNESAQDIAKRLRNQAIVKLIETEFRRKEKRSK